ncbi:Hypothetical predicted protein [Cloeon dipterum]|uniref:Uncharacterized protein n=1 Tax=Cloeon dipterum TaxID=197152 RepID=A0A8S1CAL9_9INSE|nr:Hypothetical predicted protein [Cloeon dipterum]
MPLYFPNMRNDQSQQEHQNIENNAQKANQVDRNFKKNCRNPEEAMQQNLEAFFKEWTKQGLDSVSFENNNAPSKPVAAPNPALIASTSRERLQVRNPAGHSLLREGVQKFRINSFFSAQTFSEPAKKSQRDKKGFCVMCEIDFDHTSSHWTDWHSREGIPCYTETTWIDQTRLLLPLCTDVKKELKKCQGCEKVFFNHRCDNHGCPVPSTSSAQPDVNAAPVLASTNKQKGYCLMCKFTFDDLAHHRRLMHKGNLSYALRLVCEQLTLLPHATCDAKELKKCFSCPKVTYKYHFQSGPDVSPYCLTCRSSNGNEKK